MVRSRTNGFTLVEILIVISIIVLLMSLLIPAIGAAARAVKSTTAQSRVDTLAAIVMEYKSVFGAYPLDRNPTPAGPGWAQSPHDTSLDGNYPPYYYPDGTASSTIFMDDGEGNGRAYGGKYLVYFLMGPDNQGWHRKSSSTLITNRNKGLTAEWEAPSAARQFLINSPVTQGRSANQPFAVFADGFGLEGNNGGTIAYIRRNQYATTVDTQWNTNTGPMSAAMYEDCRSHPSYPGDDKGYDHLKKMLGQCPEGVGFALISPGPDRRFGYRVTVMTFSGTDRKGSWSNLTNGVIDDIANFPLK